MARWLLRRRSSSTDYDRVEGEEVDGDDDGFELGDSREETGEAGVHANGVNVGGATTKQKEDLQTEEDWEEEEEAHVTEEVHTAQQ